MEIRQFLRLPKTIVKAGEWRCGALASKGKMQKGSFPLGKRGYILGSQWWWRVDELACGIVPCRLLTAYRLDKSNYQAWLSIERVPGAHTVVASLEYHGDHPGWHVHTKCAEIADFEPRTHRQRNNGIRIPPVGAYHRARAYEMSHQEATNRAYRMFRVRIEGEGLFA